MRSKANVQGYFDFQDDNLVFRRNLLLAKDGFK